MVKSCSFKHASMVGVFAVILFVACLFWKYTISDAQVAQFHMMMLKTAIPGFKGYDTQSIISGGVLFFAYGFLASFVFHAFHRSCCKK